MKDDFDRSLPSCLYFPRLTADEEFQFSDISPPVVDWIVAATRDIPAVDELIGAYQDVLKIDLLQSFRRYQQIPGPIGNRTTQLALYVILGNFIEHVAGEKVTCVSFYSSGAQAAYIFAGVFGARAYLETALPVNNSNRTEIVASGQRLDLAEMLVRTTDSSDEPVEKILTDAIERLHVDDRVFLKDRRGEGCCVVAGHQRETLLLFEALQRNESLRLSHPHKADGAHIPVYDRRPLEKLAERITFRKPRLPIVGASGELVTPQNATEQILRDTYLDGVIGPLNTGAAMETASTHSEQLIMAGTLFGGKVLNADITRSFGRVIYPSDFMSLTATFA
jgi:hypothetical protein